MERSRNNHTDARWAANVMATETQRHLYHGSDVQDGTRGSEGCGVYSSIHSKGHTVTR